MNNIKKEIKELGVFFKKHILKSSIIIGVIFIISILSSFLMFRQNQNVASKIVNEFSSITSSLENLKGLSLSKAIFLNNLRACVLTVLMGFIPFVYLVFMVLFPNASLMGAVFSVAKIEKLGKMILFGILPHGIFELPALFISMALSVYLCTFITKKIFKKEDKKFMYALKEVFLTFLIIVLPLLILAGIIEGVVTPILLTKFAM